MPMYFEKIGKSIDKFLKLKEYTLDRRAEFEVSADNVTWKNKTILKENAIESELKVSVKREKDTFGFETSTKPNTPPEFTFETERLSFVSSTKLKYKDPVAEVEIKRAKGPTAIELKLAANTSASTMDDSFNICYQASDYVNVGGEVKFEKQPMGSFSGPTSYAIGVQYQRNSNQTLAAKLTNTKSDQTGLLGVQAKKFYKDYTGYLQATYGMVTQQALVQVGASRPFGSASLLRGVYRYGTNGTNNASLMFEHTMEQNKVNAAVALNVDLTKNNGSSLEYKLVFG